MPPPLESVRSRLPPPLLTSRNLGVVGIVGAAFLLLLVLTLSGGSALSSIRGYVLGEGLWSKAQKRSVLALHRYARSGAEQDWLAFDAEIALTLGDRMAREELERPDPDMTVVMQGFEQGGIPEEFRDGMAALFRRARNVGFVDRAIGIWTEGDRHIDRLREVAVELREARETPDPDRARVDALLREIDTIDAELTLLEGAFTATLNDGAFEVERVLRWVLLAIAGIVVLSAAVAGRFFYRQVRIREAFLERSEARYRTLFEDSVVGTVVASIEGRILRANTAFAEMLGYDSADELVGLPSSSLYVHPEEREGLMDRLREEGAVLMDELLARRKDGTGVWLMTSSVLLRDPMGGREQVLATCLDISGRKEMEEHLSRKGRIEAMGALAGGIAHDFNNLLTAIRGNAALLQTRLATDEEGDDVAEILSEILDSSRTAADLTEQLLAFSRGDPSRASAVDLAGLVRRTMGLLERLLPENITLETELSDVPAVVEAPLAQLEQVLLNLVINARDAMPSGGHLSIDVDRCSVGDREREALVELPPGEYVRLRVADDGVGVPPEIRARLFEPFFTTKGDRGGTGMGLAIVYGVVTRAGGSVHVETAAGEGATFHVLLPRSVRAESLPEAPTIQEAHRSGETILLVEDEDAVRRVARRILESAGYRVLEAPDGERAMAFVEADAPFDLLLTDVVMPGMSGPELARRVVERRPDVPVLFVSGYADVSLEGPGLDQAVTASLPKPFSPKDLVEHARRMLGTSMDERA